LVKYGNRNGIQPVKKSECGYAGGGNLTGEVVPGATDLHVFYGSGCHMHFNRLLLQ